MLMLSRQSDHIDYVQSIYTGHMEASIVVVKFNYTQSKVIPVYSWSSSNTELDVVDAALELSQKVSRFYRYDVINADTLDSDGKPISSFSALFYNQRVSPIVKKTCSPLAGFVLLERWQKQGYLDCSEFGRWDRLQAELKLAFDKREEPSVFVMAFLQGLIFKRYQIT